MFLVMCLNYVMQIRLQNVTRLCHTKSMVTVNGKFPGPRIVAREGDRVLIKVVNHVSNNISIHWYNSKKEFWLTVCKTVLVFFFK